MKDSRPHLLLSNDDGIGSGFLHVLSEALSDTFRLSVVAPKTQCSWVGRSMSRHRPVRVETFDRLPCPAWAVEGTPTDCVNIALGHLLAKDPPVGVCGGINIGFNGLPLILGSGTLAIAIEAVAWGLMGIAFSHCVSSEDYASIRQTGLAEGSLKESLEHAALHSVHLSEQALENPLSDCVHNINYPLATNPETPLERTIPGHASLGSVFASNNQTDFHFQSFARPEDSTACSDTACLDRGHISHSILNFRSLGMQAEL